MTKQKYNEQLDLAVLDLQRRINLIIVYMGSAFQIVCIFIIIKIVERFARFAETDNNNDAVLFIGSVIQYIVMMLYMMYLSERAV